MSKLIKNTSFYTIGNILPQAVSFFLLPVYTRYLTPADYGITSSLQVLSSILIILFTFAIDRSVYRMYFEHKTEAEKKDYLGTITIALLCISCFILIMIFIFNEVVGQVYKSIPFYPYYTYAILATFLSVFQMLPKMYFQLNEKAGKYVFVSLIQFISNVGFTLWFVTVKMEGAAGSLKGTLFANIIILPLMIYISYRTINFKFRYALFIDSLKFSLPMIPALICAFVMNLSDRIFIERYFTLTDVGIYSMGYKIAGLLSLVASSFLVAYGPVFYKNSNLEDQILAKKKLAKYNYLFILVVILLAFIITFFSKEAIMILLAPKYWDSYKIIPIIAFGYILTITTGLFNFMIHQREKTASLMIIQLVGAVINVILNFILIPIFGAYGAAFATVLSFAVLLVLTWKSAIKSYYIPIEGGGLFLLLIIIFAFLIALFQYIIDLNVYISLLCEICLCGIGVLVFAKRYYSEIRNMFR